MAEIRLVNLTKRFGKTTAVDQINLTANDKEFWSLWAHPGAEERRRFA